ncbi:hypothetical protein GCM10018785_11300 [Streptomyces longispororuber]|uniref:Lipoprotein n=2 Tax=Streptomyces longispororuber TaxID=68230 RepID=A0A918ZAM9_9ACTN|nr:hypothetical protein GCM10018785_11300 [Streptomyces longispororuber]
MWGKAVGALVLAATVAAASGCGGSGDEDTSKPTAKAEKAPGVKAAVTAFQDAVTEFDEDGGCVEKKPGTCWPQMKALMKPARDLRKAANADTKNGPKFWSKAYALISTMEKGFKVGDDQGVPAGESMTSTNRDEVFGSARELSVWLDQHPTS